MKLEMMETEALQIIIWNNRHLLELPLLETPSNQGVVIINNFIILIMLNDFDISGYLDVENQKINGVV